jgi:16S rRNA processing protein RimM
VNDPVRADGDGASDRGASDRPTSDGAASDSPLVAVGRIGKPHGVRGDVFVEPWTDSPSERFFSGAVFGADPVDRGPLTVAAVHDHSGRLVLHFTGVDDRDSVESLRGTILTVAAIERPPIEDPDEFYDTDLIGLMAQTVSGDRIGPVADVLHSAGASLLAIDASGREVLVPFHKHIVPVVDLEHGVLEIDPPDGLLDL